ncbi:unnamed protein product [Linum trigynum]|uniref:Uncharacterized protein n=1 Tax=Linum trigynum TaxID=586398 RepID=A0AAV2CKS2_9ROSI
MVVGNNTEYVSSFKLSLREIAKAFELKLEKLARNDNLQVVVTTMLSSKEKQHSCVEEVPNKGSMLTRIIEGALTRDAKRENGVGASGHGVGQEAPAVDAANSAIAII